ncbi:serine/threonine-protein kinase [Leifsonia poae]
MIGRGGMATVYSAQDLQLDRAVAVKVFAAGEASDDARRRAETQLLARLNHPNLVTLFDAHLAASDADEDPSYLVMELVDGPSLRDELKRGPLPAPEVAALAVELAEALVAVHAAGVVHRDLKPANILLALTGLPSVPYRGKLADFGIAHLVGSERITSNGIVIGTAAYLSPEQAHGAEPGPPADIYSLGLVLIEALTGNRAFPGTAAESLGARVVRDPLVPSNLPPAWAELLTAMTARPPEARPDALEVAVRAREHAAELDGWAPGADETAPATVVAGAAGAGVAAVAAPDDPTLLLTQASAPPPIAEPPARRPRRGLIGAIVAVAVVAVAVAAVIGVGAWIGANAPAAGPSHTPSQTVAPVAPVSSTPPSPRPTPSVTTPPASTPATPTTTPSDKGNGKGNGKPGNDDGPGPGKGKVKKDKG